MGTEGNELFEILEPPAGGAERLRARLRGPERARTFLPRPLLAGAGLAAAIGAAAYLGLHLARDATDGPQAAPTALIDAPEFDRLLGREPPPLPLRVEVNGERVEVEQVASDTPAVRIYRLN